MTDAESSASRILPQPAPREMGFHMPAEWEPHQATWFSWPHNPETWVHHLPTVEIQLAAAVRHLAEHEDVFINVLDATHREHVARILKAEAVTGKVHLLVIPTNDSWCRDHGATFLIHPHTQHLAAINWGFNAWGGKYPPFDLDNTVPVHMSNHLDVPRWDVPFILEGGSIEVNGQGTVLTTRECLLNPNRNPGYGQEAVERILHDMLGTTQVIWLSGDLAGDDTDGHIDNIARFADERTIVLPVEKNTSDPNYACLESNFRTLQYLCDTGALDCDLVPLPMPAPYVLDGVRLPANYANFYIANDVVLLPVFDDPADKEAAAILRECFPGREVIPVDCTAIIWGLGALHCLTQQVPLVIS